jgi:putative transposase
MSYNNLRTGRVSLAGHAYLITAVTDNRQPLFNELIVGRIVVQTLRTPDEEGLCRTLAFVVMPDHVHWLLELTGSQSLDRVVKLFKGRVAAALAKRAGQSIRVWQPSFHDHAVRTNESLVEMARYIIMNPVRAGLVNRIGDYPLWDSIWLNPL